MAARSMKRKIMDEINYSSDEFNQFDDSDGSEYTLRSARSSSCKRPNKRLQTSASFSKGNKQGNHDPNLSEDDDDENEEYDDELSKSMPMKTETKVQRRPTRKPNPKISNRNALMARENRRKKKEFLETLQRNVHETQSENKKLKKMLRERNETITKLTNEGLYLRSILANKTEIMSLLKTIQGNRVPITSSTLSFVADEPVGPQQQQQYQEVTSNCKRINSYASSSGCSPNSVSTMSSTSPFSHHSGHDYEEDDEDLVDNEKENDLSDPFTDDVTMSSMKNTIQWEDLLNESVPPHSDFKSIEITDLRDIDDNEILSTNNNDDNVKNEHNYFNNPITNKVVANGGQQRPTQTQVFASATVNDNGNNKQSLSSSSAPGICLHVSNGRVSLEFCSVCHQNSENAWIEEI